MVGDIGWDELGDVEGHYNGDRETIPLSLSVKSRGKLSFSHTLVTVTGTSHCCFDFFVCLFVSVFGFEFFCVFVGSLFF